MLSKIHLIHCMLNQLKVFKASESVDVKAFLSMAEVSLASSIVLSLEPRTNSLRVRAEIRVCWEMSSPINLSSVTVSLCVTCHGVALLGHLAEPLDQGLAQLPAAAGPAAPPPGHRYPVSIYNVTLAISIYLVWSIRASSAGSGRWIFSTGFSKKIPCLSFDST